MKTKVTEQKYAELTDELLNNINAYWRAANYLSVGQIYLRDNPLLKKSLKIDHIKKMLLGHWGTTPGQNFIYVHLNRIIKKYDLNMIYISGPGHGGPALVSNTYLEGTYSEIYPDISRDEIGLKKLFPFSIIQDHILQLSTLARYSQKKKTASIRWPLG